METDGVVFYSYNKNNFYIRRLFEKIFVSVTNRFLVIKYVTSIKESTFT